MNALTLLRVAVLMGLASQSACQTPQPRPATERIDPALAAYRAPLAGEGTRYRIDAAASQVLVYVFRGGAAAKYGHNHVLSVPKLEGELLLPGDELRAAQFSLRFRLDELAVDEPALRAQTRGNFSGERSASDIAGTQRNLLKSLEAGQFPEVVLNSVSIAGDWPLAVARVAVTLHGVTCEQTLPLRVERVEDEVRASGSFALRQSDHGAKPFSILGGALAVQDELAIEFRLVARAAR